MSSMLLAAGSLVSFDALLDSFQYLLTPKPFLLLLLGTTLGIVVGAMPGLTGAMLISLTLPLTFSMDSADALILLIAMYVGSISGGLITATLLRMPGTPASIMTTLDGYPLARSGQPGRALGLSINASFVGGLVSWVFLLLLAEPMAELSTRLSKFDYFALVLMALVLIAAVSGRSLLKGIFSGILGMLATMPGLGPFTGEPRMTFGLVQLNDGLKLLPVLIGLFAVSQIIDDMIRIDHPLKPIPASWRGIGAAMRDCWRQPFNLIRSSLIGTWVGILPGIGANIGSVMAYMTARTMSKKPERFGAGSEEGIIASEAANNATIGGALIPLISMGIPGSVIDAILLGALVIHELQPGPLLFKDNPEIVYIIIASMLLANCVMFAFMLASVGMISKLMYVPRSFLIPTVLVFCVVGAYALDNRMFDVQVMLAFGLIGFGMERWKVPLAPFVIGFVLAPIAERSLGAGLQLSGGSYWPLLDFTRPAAYFCVIALALLGWPILRRRFVDAGCSGPSDARQAKP